MEALLAANAYANSTKTTGSPRGVEYQVFARITRDLTNAKNLPKSEFPKLAAAIHDNIRLWTIIGTDVAQDGNALSPELRSKLFYLFQFTRSHSNKVLHGEATVDSLIDVNTSIMRGLKGVKANEE